MKLVDLNILLYAVNSDGPHHARAHRWVEEALAGEDAVALPWVVVMGFIRLATSRRVFQRPLTMAQALAIVDGWLALPHVVLLHPGQGHWAILKELLTERGAGGDLATDAHLAALAIEQGCDLCSTDADFARFARVRWVNPLSVG